MGSGNLLGAREMSVCRVFQRWRMRRESVLWGVLVSRFEAELDRFGRRRLSADEAGELLGCRGVTSAGCACASRPTGSRGCAIGAWGSRRRGAPIRRAMAETG